MEHNFWSFPIRCAKCDQPTHLQTFQFSANGELRLNTYCFDCKLVNRHSVTMERLKQMALDGDIEEHIEQCLQRPAKRPIKPPLAIPPPLITPEDKKFEHDCGIDPEEGQ